MTAAEARVLDVTTDVSATTAVNLDLRGERAITAASHNEGLPIEPSRRPVVFWVLGESQWRDKLADLDIDGLIRADVPSASFEHVEWRRQSDQIALTRLLDSFKTRGEDWDGYGAEEPDAGTIETAKRVLDHLPSSKGLPRASLSGEGDVVFVWRSRDERIYLTIENATLHLLVMRDHAPNVYIDDLPYDGGDIPDEVLDHLPPSSGT